MKTGIMKHQIMMSLVLIFSQNYSIMGIFKEEDVTDFAPDNEADDAEYRESGFNGCRQEDGSGLKPNQKSGESSSILIL